MFKRVFKFNETLILLFVFLIVLLVTHNAIGLTPAGEEIRNQSVATYEDPNGNEFESKSNIVITTVAEIYSFGLALPLEIF